jgi:hypothetical protein
MEERESKIKEYRISQDASELDRKASKACRYKQKIWTQEELDAAEHKGAELHKFFSYE